MSSMTSMGGPGKAPAWHKLPQTRLPNGLNIRYVSRKDVAFLYREIYEEQNYLRGLCLKQGNTVLDIGANIGLFGLRAAEALGVQGRVICMEPIPNAEAALQHNIHSHREWCLHRGVTPADIEVLNAGASDGSQTSATFTCYPDAAGWSTMQPNDQEVQDGVATYLQNSLRTQAGLEKSWLISLARLLQQLLPIWLTRWLFRWYASRMLARRQEVTCALTTVSDVIRQQQLSRVHLMKIDVERAELDVVRGVEAQHWPLIDQVVAEVHDLQGSLEAFLQVLRDAGFASIKCDQDPALAGSTMYLVAASRTQQV